MSLASLSLLAGLAVPLASLVAGARASDPLWLWRSPRLLLRSLLVVLIIVPLIGTLLVDALSPVDVVIRAGVEVAILSIGMEAPGLLKRAKAPEAFARYAISLNPTLLLVAVVYIPLAVELHGALFDHQLSLAWRDVARLVHFTP